jgi:hypothetical protein
MVVDLEILSKMAKIWDFNWNVLFVESNSFRKIVSMKILITDFKCCLKCRNRL